MRLDPGRLCDGVLLSAPRARRASSDTCRSERLSSRSPSSPVAALPVRVTNVVFMGMGEPLANYDRVWQSVVRMHSDMGLSARHLTISTVGMVPGIRRLAAEELPVTSQSLYMPPMTLSGIRSYRLTAPIRLPCS